MITRFPISEHEMDRRRLMAKAQARITDTMGQFSAESELTAAEWINVMLECQRRMVSIALKEEWEND